jgi:uncharacterized protein
MSTEMQHISFNTKHLKFKLEEKADNQMTFSGYASVFGNVDHTNDICLKGCFSESLARREPKVLCQHDTDDVVGKLTSYKEDDYGLYVEGFIIDTTDGLDLYKLLKAGAIDQMSIGYVTKECEYQDDGIRILKAVELYEVSFVTFPANERARVTNVKSMPKTLRDFENLLQEKGFSQKLAKIIAKNSFDAIQRDAEGKKDAQRDVEDKLIEEAKQIINNIKNR